MEILFVHLQKIMFEISFFKLFGIVVGFNYTNDEMDNLQLNEDKTHVLQFFIVFFGITIVWYSERE